MPHKDPEDRRQYHQLWRQNNKCKSEGYQQRYAATGKKYANNLLRRLGVTEENYAALEKKQRGLCAVCLKPESRKRKGKIIRLAVDHDHTTKKVRALLCSRCNVALGLLRESLVIIAALRNYVARHLGTDNLS